MYEVIKTLNYDSMQELFNTINNSIKCNYDGNPQLHFCLFRFSFSSKRKSVQKVYLDFVVSNANLRRDEKI